MRLLPPKASTSPPYTPVLVEAHQRRWTRRSLRTRRRRMSGRNQSVARRRRIFFGEWSTERKTGGGRPRKSGARRSHIGPQVEMN
jgi:hypothetical protein